MRKIRSSEDCVERDARGQRRINFKTLRNGEDVRICLFLLSRDLSGPEELVAMLGRQGFLTSSATSGEGDRKSVSASGYLVVDDLAEFWAILPIWSEWSLQYLSPISASFWIKFGLDPRLSIGVSYQGETHRLTNVTAGFRNWSL